MRHKLKNEGMNDTFNECYTPPIKFGCHISQKMMAKNALKGQTQNTLISTQQTHFLYCCQYMPKARLIQQTTVYL